MVGIILISAFLGLFTWNYRRAYRVLSGDDFTSARYDFDERRLFASTPEELRAVSSEVLASMRKSRVVAADAERALVDVRPAVTNLDDVCGLGVEIRVGAASSSASESGWSELHLRAFKKAWGRGHPALLAFSMHLRKDLRARGIHEWDPHR